MNKIIVAVKNNIILFSVPLLILSSLFVPVISFADTGNGAYTSYNLDPIFPTTSYSAPRAQSYSAPATNYGTCNGCGRQAGSASCTGCGTSRSTPTTYSQPRSGGNFINDLLDLSFGFSSVKNDNDTTITTDSHNKTNYSVVNTDNSDRSVRTNYTYTDNSEIDNSVRISSGRHIAYDDDDNDDNDDNDDLNVICRVSDTSIEEGDTVRFTADISGGDSPYEYDWRGDIDGDDRVESFRFNREGRYEVEIRVTDDDGNTDTDDCPVVVVDDEDNDDDDDDNNVNLITTTTNNPPTGNLASLNSVFLSQVPYTGSKETLTIIGYVATIFVWSVLVVYFLARRKSKMLKSSIIDSFKKGNKVAVKIG